MNPIEQMMDEHRLIERVLEALGAFADRTGKREIAGEKRELARFVEFIRGFADHYHHAKEEDILFDEMLQAGFSKEGGPIAVMLMEHDEGRAHVKKLAGFAAQETPWSAEDRTAIATTAQGFITLLRGHIQKEDAILYPMALNALAGEKMDSLVERCTRHEARTEVRAENTRLRDLAKDLTAATR